MNTILGLVASAIIATLITAALFRRTRQHLIIEVSDTVVHALVTLAAVAVVIGALALWIEG
jgi:phosphoribosyl-ATP pyrophosphohydrolase